MINKKDTNLLLYLKESSLELLTVLKSMLPKNKIEVILFLFLTILYGSFGWIIATETCIQDCLIKRYDVYFSYDVGMRFHGVPFGSDVAHPLFNLFATPISLFFEFFGDLYNNHKIKTIGFGVVCNILVSMSVVYVLRYLQEVVRITNMSIVLLFTSFYALSFTCVMLSFTVETYAFSVFFLSFFVYYYSLQIQDKRHYSFMTNLFFSLVIGGITITNTIKTMIPVFFFDQKKTKSFKQVFSIGLIVGICFFSAIYHDGLYELFMERFTQALPEQNYSVSFLQAWESLVGGAVLFPNISIVSAFIPKEFAPVYQDYFLYQIDAISFSYFWEHSFTVLLSLLLFVTFFIDYRNKLVQLLFLIFFVDVFIHLIVKFGMHEAHIYGGHWIYIIPLLFGWGYKALKSWKKNLYLTSVVCLFTCMVVSNYIRLIDFIELSKIVWPSEAYKW